MTPEGQDRPWPSCGLKQRAWYRAGDQETLWDERGRGPPLQKGHLLGDGFPQGHRSALGWGRVTVHSVGHGVSRREEGMRQAGVAEPRAVSGAGIVTVTELLLIMAVGRGARVGRAHAA